MFRTNRISVLSLSHDRHGKNGQCLIAHRFGSSFKMGVCVGFRPGRRLGIASDIQDIIKTLSETTVRSDIWPGEYKCSLRVSYRCTQKKIAFIALPESLRFAMTPGHKRNKKQGKKTCGYSSWGSAVLSLVSTYRFNAPSGVLEFSLRISARWFSPSRIIPPFRRTWDQATP
ncbi:hypothetical protein AVEN_102062-1 [Araneus ventricosus]|uniref:Uncharacterized protein n=1 Tax=Araneus ventricosus TaxID=182803 RepID=A0A4Y2VKB1_ARAVE|nr:hypothetical protein AVEN_102062-1 [Araneus ventricosus]